MITIEIKDQYTLYLGYSVLGIIFLVDCFVNFGAVSGIPYVLAFIGSVWLLKPKDILWFGGACSGLAFLAFLIGEDATFGVFMSRVMAMSAIGLITLLNRRQLETYENRFEQEKQLNLLVEKRTEGLKQVVVQLEEKKIRLAESEELGHFGFWEYYPRTQQMVWSNGVFVIHGIPFKPHAPSLQEFLNQCHPEDVQILKRSIQYGLTEKKPYTVEYRLLMRDGSVKQIFSRGRSVLDGKGRINYLVGTIQDVTAVTHRQDPENANQTKHTAFFKQAAVGKVIMIPNKRILEANHAFSKWIGYSEESLLAMPLEQLIHEEDRSPDSAYIQKIISGEISFYQKEKRFVHREGTILWGLLNVWPLYDAEEKITCFAVEVIDVTIQKNMLAVLQEAQAMREEARESLVKSETSRKLLEDALRESEKARLSAEDELRAYLERGGANEQYLEDAQPAGASSHTDAPVRQPEATFEASSEPYEDPGAVFQPVYDFEPPPNAWNDLFDVSDDSLGFHSGNDASKPDPTYRAAEDAINNLLRLTKDLMAVIGFDGRYKRVSPTLAAALGYEPEALEDQSFLNFIHEEDREQVLDRLSSLQQGASILDLKLRHLSEREGFQWFFWEASVNEELEIIYAVMKPAGEIEAEPPATAPIDSSSSKPDRQEQAPPLPDPEKQVDWRLLTDKMPFQIWMLGVDQSCLYANKKVRDFTGLTFEQLEGNGWSKAIHPDDYRDFTAYYQNAFDLQEPMGCMYRLRRGDGNYRWIQESSVPIWKPDGSFEGYLVTCMEVNGLKALGEKFVKAYNDVVEMLDLKSALHPCRHEENMDILTDSVKIGDALVANAREVPSSDLARLMDHAGRRLLDLAKDTLQFKVANKKTHDLRKRSVSLEKVLNSTFEMLAPVSPGERARFQIDQNDPEFRINADKDLVEHMFDNLVMSLLEWADTRTIVFDIRERDGAGVVEIRHIGSVMKPGLLNRLEDLFRSETASHLQKNIYLELSLIKRMAETTDVEMEIKAVETSGPVIEFRFDLAKRALSGNGVKSRLHNENSGKPAQVRQFTEVVEAMASLEAPSSRFATNEPVGELDEEILIHENGTNGRSTARHRVLVGEADNEMQRLVRSLLQPYYDLTIVPGTEDLLKQAESSQFDLLLVDIQIQGDRSGVDVLRELRRRRGYAGIPAVAVAASNLSVDERELMDGAGFDGFLRKPYSIVELLEVVERLINS